MVQSCSRVLHQKAGSPYGSVLALFAELVQILRVRLLRIARTPLSIILRKRCRVYRVTRLKRWQLQVHLLKALATIVGMLCGRPGRTETLHQGRCAMLCA